MAIEFSINGNNKGFKQAADDTMRSMKAMAQEATNTQGQVSGMFKDIAKQTAAFAGISLGAAGLKSFATSIVDVRKEMQSLNTSFKVLLGNDAAAEKMFRELKEFASATPLMLKDLASGAQTMLGFNIDAEKVMPTLKAIGDISMGNAQRFQSLTLAFSQMSATGKLMGQDLLQMINAGFNPLTEIAEKTGKTIAQLKEEMSDGAISAEMVSDAFLSATAEGGKFYGMLDKQGKDIAGQINRLSGALDDMFNALGEQSESVITGAISGVTTLVQSYEKVGKILATLVATYGAYKAATIAVAAIEMSNAVGIGITTKSMWESVLATKAGTVAQKAFNAAVKANPYVMLASTLVAIVGLLWSFSSGSDQAAIAQQKLGKAMSDFEDKQKKEAEEIRNLLAAIQDKSATDAQRILAYQQLETKCSALTQKYTMEELAVVNLTAAYKDLNQVQETDRIKALVEDTNQKVRVYNDLVRVKTGKQKYGSAETQQFIKDNGLTGMNADEELKMLKAQIDEQRKQYQEYADAQSKAKSGTTYQQDAKKALSDWKKAKEEYDKLTKSQTATSKEVSEARSKVESADKKYEELTGKKASEQAKDNGKQGKNKQDIIDFEDEQARERTRKARENEISVAEARVSGMKEGLTKTIAQIELDYRKELASIVQGEEQLLADREENARKQWELTHKKEVDSGQTWTSSGAQASFRATNQLTEDDRNLSMEKDAAATSKYEMRLKEQYRRILGEHHSYYDKREEIERKYQENKAALDLLESKSTDKSEKEQVQRAIQQLESDTAKERMQVAMEELQADPAFIEAFEDLNNVSTQTLDSLYNRLEALKPTLANLPADKLKVITDLMSKINKTKLDRSTSTFTDLKKAIEELHTAESEENADQDKIAKAQKKVNDLWAKAKSEVDELANAIGALGQEIGGEAQEYMQLASSTMTFITSTIDSVKRMAQAGAQALSTIEKASVILLIIQAAIQVFIKLNEVMNKFSDAADYKKLVEKQNEINKLTDAVNQYTMALLKAQQEESSWFGESSLRDLANLQEQSLQVSENYYSKLYEIQVKYRNKQKNDNNWTMFLDPTIGTIRGIQTLADNYDAEYVKAIDNLRIETRSRKKSFMGIGGHDQKTADLREWARENFDGAELFDEDNFINVELAQSILDSYGNKLQGNTKDTLEQLIELKEQYDEYEESLKEYVNEMYSPLVDNMTDAIWAWYDSGKDALASFREDASDTFRAIVNDMIQQIVLANIVDKFQDDINEIYKKYNAGEIDYNALIKQISMRTSDMVDTYEASVPVLEDMVTTMSNTIEDALGINMQGDSSSSTTSIAANVTQDSVDEANGRLTAIQMQGETIIGQTLQLIGIGTQTNVYLSDMLDLNALRNSYLLDIYDRLGALQTQFYTQLEAINTHTKNI